MDLRDVLQFVADVVTSAFSMLNSASAWMLFSFFVAGVCHEFVGPDKMKKTAISSTRFSGVLWATLTGMCLPICSCGTIPLGISMYTISGMLMAGVLFTVVPQSAITRYLGDPGMISLLGITAVAALMYVCAVGHIPFIAALVASGAAPGVAITFLMAGCATNIAELLTIRKTIGRRSVIMYSSMVILLSEIMGYVTNRLLPDYQPVLDFDAVTHSISKANVLIVEVPGWLQSACSLVLVAYACVSLVRWLKER